jgi:DNA-binding response OmpR family regulator
MNELKSRIVCVDDDEDTCEMMRALLSDAGYDVLIATTVKEGLSLVKYGGCDLVLLDGQFPDGTGLEMCRIIRAYDSRTPILFCSGAADKSDIEDAMRSGAQGYLVKPCSLEKLEQTIAGLLVKECQAV